MKFYISKEALEDLKSVTQGKRELSSTSMWGTHVSVTDYEVVLKATRCKKKFHENWIRRLRRAHISFWGTFLEK